MPDKVNFLSDLKFRYWIGIYIALGGILYGAAQKGAQPPWAGFKRIQVKIMSAINEMVEFFAQKFFIIFFGQFGLIFCYVYCEI